MEHSTEKNLLVMVLGFSIITFLVVDELALQLQILMGIVAVATTSMMIPALGRLIVKGWMLLAEKMGWVMSRVLLSIVFYFFLFPISLIYKVTRNNPLQLKKVGDTAFTERNHKYVKADIENPW
jgi:hypothetical protein